MRISSHNQGFVPAAGVIVVAILLGIGAYALTVLIQSSPAYQPTPSSRFERINPWYPVSPRPSVTPHAATPTPTWPRRYTPAPAPIGTGIYGIAETEIVMGPAGRRVPYTGELIVKAYATKQEVARVTPDASGRFSVALAPGRYYVVPARGTWLWAERYPRVIEVKSGTSTYADLFFSPPQQ